MPRVKCPHCGAGNQDATDDDTCWQCSNVLNSPVTRAENTNRPSANISSEPTQQLSAEMLRNLAPEALPAQKQSKKPSAPNPVLILLAGVLIAAVFLLIYALTRR